MAHALYHLRKKVVNTPQLMSLSEFENVIEYLDNSDTRDVKKPELNKEEDLNHNSRYTIYQDDLAAIFTIEGPMTYKPVSFYGMDCGGFSYQQFKKDFSYVVSQGVKTVGLMIDSGGGEAHQLFPTMAAIKKLASENDVKIVSYVDGIAASAAYGTAVIADEIIMSEGSEVGSIGVVVRLMNDTKKLEKDGYERIFVTAGADKVALDGDGKFKESFLQDIQDKVDVMYGEFVSHVASFRNISEELVRSTEARTYLPKEAMSLGLADKVMSVDEFYNYISQMAESRVGGKDMKLPKNPFSMKTETKEETLQMEEMQKVQELLSAKEAELCVMTEKLAELTALMATKEAALTDALTQLTAAKADKELAEKQAKHTERVTKLSEVMTKAQAEETAKSLEALADESFNVVLEGYQRQYTAMQESELFKQMSQEAQEEKDKVVEQNAQAKEDPVASATREAMKARGLTQ